MLGCLFCFPGKMELQMLSALLGVTQKAFELGFQPQESGYKAQAVQKARGLQELTSSLRVEERAAKQRELWGCKKEGKLTQKKNRSTEDTETRSFMHQRTDSIGQKGSQRMGENTRQSCTDKGVNIQHSEGAPIIQQQKTKNLVKRWTEDLNEHFSKEDNTNGQKAREKMVNISNR